MPGEAGQADDEARHGRWRQDHSGGVPRPVQTDETMNSTILHYRYANIINMLVDKVLFFLSHQ